MSNKKNKNKEEGNAFERKVAKEMSLWLFENRNILRRSSDSGAQKANYSGDIIPEGQLPTQWNRKWPIIVECKYGYKTIAIPNIWNRKWITTWYLKALNESKKHNQPIVFIVNNFKNRKFNTITSNIQFNHLFILHEISFPVIVDQYVHHLFVYNYKKVLQLHIDNLIPDFFNKYC